LFIAQESGTGTLQVSLGGQSLSFSAISTESDYTLYGGNIPSDLDGKSEQLMLTALAGNNNFWEIDDIQFAPLAVPEPNAFGLFALGGLILSLCHQRKSSPKVSLGK
jgi:hypothetical protein